MAPRLPNPLGIAGAPAELVAALRHLPEIARHTRSMAADTEALADVRRDIARVAERTEGIQTMDGRMANIEAAMPVLIELQKHVALVPDTLAALDERLNRLSEQLDRLADSVEDLQRSVKPLGRIAGRLPGSGSRTERQAADSD